MSLRTQILALLAIPFIALTLIGGFKTVADWERYENAQINQSDIQTSVALLKVIHQLQVERGLSAVFLTSNGTTAGTDLKEARTQVDRAIEKIPSGADAPLQHLDQVGDLRKQVSAQHLTTGEMGARYSAVIADMLSDVGKTFLHQNSNDLAQISSALMNMTYAKEAAGQQRAAGATGFVAGQFDQRVYNWFASTGAREQQLLDIAELSFVQLMPDLQIRKGLAATELPAIRQEVLMTPPGAAAPNYLPLDWFERATVWIESLYKVEASVADQMTLLAAQEAQSARLSVISTGAAMIISLLVSSFIAWRLIRSFSRQINFLQDDLDRLSRKEFDFEPAQIDARNEIGRLSRAMDQTRVALAEAEAKLRDIENNRIAARGAVVGTLDEHLARLSKRDLTCAITETFPEEYEELRKSFNDTVETLKGTMEQVVDASSSIHNGATEISSASEDLSSRTESQAATLEETAAALEQLTASVKSSADGARDVEHTVKDARQEAVMSGEVVQNAVAAMTKIEESSKKISQIIAVIDDIAFQTNLLALNAGVEAARAGDAGKGFAVVASEVRALAQRSGEAATEIKALIGDSSKQVSQGVELVRDTGEALSSIVERVNAISDLVSNIAEAAAEQSIGLSEINMGVGQLDQVTQQNAAMVEEATAAGHMLHADAGNLADLMAQFSIDHYAPSPKIKEPSQPVSETPLAREPLPPQPPQKIVNGGWEEF